MYIYVRSKTCERVNHNLGKKILVIILIVINSMISFTLVTIMILCNNEPIFHISVIVIKDLFS